MEINSVAINDGGAVLNGTSDAPRRVLRPKPDVPYEYLTGKSRDGRPWFVAGWSAKEMQGFCRQLIESRLPVGWFLESIVYRSEVVPVREVKAVVRDSLNVPYEYVIPVPRAPTAWSPPVGKVLMEYFAAEFAGVA